MTRTETVVFALGESSLETARKVSLALDAPIVFRGFGLLKPDAGKSDVGVQLREHFQAGRTIVGVCAAGILIRSLAQVLRSKLTEPPVICVADDGSAVVPLLGGHRGANSIAVTIADALGCKAAVTTASDAVLGVALDDPPAGWRLENPWDVKSASAAILAGAKVRVSGEAAWLVPLIDAVGAEQAGSLGEDGPIVVQAEGAETLTYRRQAFALGVGCSRGCCAADLIGLVNRSLADSGISIYAVKGVYSIDAKSDEAAVHALAAELGVPARFYSADELNEESARLDNPSEVVHAAVGSYGVCEAAALAAAGPEGSLEIPKRKSANATCALARIGSGGGRKGIKRGRLSIVGIGPGDREWRTPEAVRHLWQADELVGYRKYLDLAGEEFASIPSRRFELGEEVARCKYALEQAALGRNIALVTSGDAGIYAMGSLVMELLEGEFEGSVSDSAKRVDVVCVPGITAMQAASARVGAMLGNDFCAISLSDLLTPEAEIIRRVEAAGAGNFVTAFYNPASNRRRSLLNKARDILLQNRSPETPVLLARNLGRDDEAIKLIKLAELDVSLTDMMTVVIVGNQDSRAFRLGDRSKGSEGWHSYTPRGYGPRLTGASET